MALKSDLLKPDYIDRYGGDTRKLEKPRLENPLFKTYKNDMSSRVMEASTGDDYSPDKLIQRIEIAREMGDDDLVQELLSDLYRLYGLYNQGGLASLPGYAPGGPVGSDLFGANMPSHRADPENYFKSIKKIGEVTKKKFLKKDGSIDIKKFNRFAIKQGADPLDKSPKGILRFTKWMNSYLPKGLKYEPVMIDKPGPGAGTKVFTAESTIRQQPGTVGAGLNKEIYDKGQKLNRTALKKFPNSKTARLKYIVDGLYKTFNRYENVTKTFLKNFVKGRGFLSITPMGVATSLAMEMMEDPDYMKAVGFGESEPMVLKGGGMADIYDMTKPLKKYEHGGFEDRMSMLRKAMTDTEATRRADMETGDPERERRSTYGTVMEEEIRFVAEKIASEQGKYTKENINSIMRQLMALVPSLEQTMGERTKYAVPKGLDALKEKASIMMGLKSDPMLRRDVGFERVR